MAQAVHIVPVEAASREDEPRDETQILWLELEVPATSPWCEKDLVCAGRGSLGGLFQQASEIAFERNGSTGDGILVARHHRVTRCCGFHLQLFLPQKIADKFTWRGIQSTITAVLVYEGPQFISE